MKTIVPRTEIDAVEERGLLVVPESIKAEYVPMPITGIIIGVGDELKAEGELEGVSSLKEGDMIMFSRVSGLQFTINSKDLRIIHANDILAVLADTDESVVEVKSVPGQ